MSVSLEPPTGYVLTFSNGLVAYLSGDMGITAEQDAVRVPVHLPLSGRTMAFDGEGICVKGC